MPADARPTSNHEELRRLLQTQRRQILAARSHQLQDLHENGETENQMVADEMDRAEADLTDDVAAALAQMAAETLRLIDEAEARLGSGEYGSCVECGQPIPVARLRALPFAVRCRPCTEAIEGPARRVRAHPSHTQEAAL